MYLLTSPHHWTTTLQSKLQLQLHLDMWVWTNFLEKSRHTHNMERSICGPRPTVLSANLYHSYPLSYFSLQKIVPKSIYQVFPKVSTKGSVSLKFLFNSFEFLPSNLSTPNQISKFLINSTMFFSLLTHPSFSSTLPSSKSTLQNVLKYPNFFDILVIWLFLTNCSRFLLNSSKLFSKLIQDLNQLFQLFYHLFKVVIQLFQVGYLNSKFLINSFKCFITSSKFLVNS